MEVILVFDVRAFLSQIGSLSFGPTSKSKALIAKAPFPALVRLASVSYRETQNHVARVMAVVARLEGTTP